MKVVLVLFALIYHAAASPTCAPPSAGSKVSHELPFTLFVSDNVSEVVFSEPTCVFLNYPREPVIDFKKLVFTVIYENGTCESIAAKSIANVHSSSYLDKLCFADSAASVILQRGDLFDGYDPTQDVWQSGILLFVAKEYVKNCGSFSDAQFDGNVYSIPEYLDCNLINASSTCPAFILTPTSVARLSSAASGCPDISVYTNTTYDDFVFYALNELPEGVRADIETVPSGILPIDDFSILSFTKETAASIQGINLIRSAITVKVNSTVWLHKFLATVNRNAFEDGNRRCHSYRNGFDGAEGVISSDPLSLQTLTATLTATPAVANPSFSFEVEPYDANCANLTISLSVTSDEMTLIQQPNTTVRSENARQAVVDFQRRAGAKCASANVKVRYSVVDLAEISTSTASSSTSTTTLPSSTTIFTSTKDTSARYITPTVVLLCFALFQA